MILEKLNVFAYFPNSRKSLMELAELAIPESWRFLEPQQPTGNQYTPILERYILYVFKNQALRYNRTMDAAERQRFIYNYGMIACFNTGLITPTFEDIYAMFEKSSKKTVGENGYFAGFIRVHHQSSGASLGCPINLHSTESLKCIILSGMCVFIISIFYRITETGSHLLCEN